MRPRWALMMFGILSVLVSGVAIIKENMFSSVIGYSITEKINFLPSSPQLYLVVLFGLGILSLVIGLTSRKIFY
ncbi:MAG: hypothetical protein ABH817_02170 [archaeon]